jgi:hypothetical protein
VGFVRMRGVWSIGTVVKETMVLGGKDRGLFI